MNDLRKGIGQAFKILNEKDFRLGEQVGLERGIQLGMKRHFTATSELTDKENELLINFLVRNNFVLCYDLQYGGFRVRKNDYLNPQPPKTIHMVDADYSKWDNFSRHVDAAVDNIKYSINGNDNI